MTKFTWALLRWLMFSNSLLLILFAEDELSRLHQICDKSFTHTHSRHSSTVHISHSFFCAARQVQASLWQCGVISAAQQTVSGAQRVSHAKIISSQVTFHVRIVKNRFN